MLLDTHSLLWLLDGGTAFGPAARKSIEEVDDVSYSAISIAEIRTKQLLGKLDVPPDLLRRIDEAGLRAVSYGPAAADGLTHWPALVRHDPFDRLLLTHAVAERTILLTADSVLLRLPEAPVQDARA